MTLAEALQKSLLFFRAQRSGDLGADNPVPFRSLPSFATDGSDVGVDLSKGYFDAGDFVKYGQPAAYTISMLAWSGLEFADGFRAAGSLSELHYAVRWGTDYILEASRHLDAQCTFYAQVGRGAAEGCDGAPGCSYDHGYWGRPEDYSAYPSAAARQTSVISAAAPGTECAPRPPPHASLILQAPLARTHLPTTLLHLLALRRNRARLPPRPLPPSRRIWAQASAALAASSLLLADDGGGERGERGAYAAALLQRAVQLYGCAVAHNPQNATLQASLPAVLPQYRSNGFSDELGWAAAWLHTATAEERYALDFQANMRRGEDRWYYEGWAASWDDVNALAKLRMLLSAPDGFAHREHLLQSVRTFVVKWSECSGEAGPPTATGCGLCWLNRWLNGLGLVFTSHRSRPNGVLAGYRTMPRLSSNPALDQVGTPTLRAHRGATRRTFRHSPTR